MTTNFNNLAPADYQEMVLAEFKRLSRFNGSEQMLWQMIFDVATELLGAKRAWYFIQNASNHKKVEPTLITSSPDEKDTDELIFYKVRELANRALISRTAEVVYTDNQLLCAMRLGKVGRSNPKAIMVFNIEQEELSLSEAKRWAMALFMELPALVNVRHRSQSSENNLTPTVLSDESKTLQEILELQLIISEGVSFEPCLQRFCNQLSTFYNCERVSLGWYNKDIQLRVQSHVQQIQFKTDATDALEKAMLEAAEIERPLLYPTNEKSRVFLSSEHYIKNFNIGHILSVPLIYDAKVVGCITLERKSEGFSSADIDKMGLLLELATPHICMLEELDKAPGKRFFSAVRGVFSAHATASYRVALIFTVMVISILATPWWNYRIEAPFLLMTNSQQMVSAPFDSFIEHINVAIGDEVKESDLLLTLEKRELQIQEAEAMAEILRYSREAEKAAVAYALVDQRIALAQKRQKEAVLKSIRYKLQQADVRSAMDGIIVEGDLKKLRGAPVRKGDMLFRISKVQDLYVEMEVDEVDINLLKLGSAGEVSFIATPRDSFPIQVYQIEPQVIAKEGGPIILVKAEVEKPLPWWRPGMTGVAKIEVGYRSPLWVIFRRTIDFLRLTFWW